MRANRVPIVLNSGCRAKQQYPRCDTSDRTRQGLAWRMSEELPLDLCFPIGMQGSMGGPRATLDGQRAFWMHPDILLPRAELPGNGQARFKEQEGTDVRRSALRSVRDERAR